MTTLPPLVGLLGCKRSGKDSLAARLVSEHGFHRFAFADPLKATMIDLDPWVRIYQDETHLFGTVAEIGPHYHGATLRIATIVERLGWEAAKEIREVRRLLQAHGVAIREHVDPETWLRATMTRVEQERRLGAPVVVTDVRFPNEAEAITASGGTLVRITRPGLDTSDQHVSETALDDYPARYTVANGGTLEQLAAAADDLVTLL